MKSTNQHSGLQAPKHGLALAKTSLGVGGNVIARPGALRFFLAFVGPLVGFAAVAVAGTALASKTPELRFHVGLGATVVGCSALAALIVPGLVSSLAFALHLGAAAAVIALAILCAAPVVAALGTAALAMGLLIAVHQRAAQEMALLVPAVGVPIIAGFLQPNVDFAVAGIAMLGVSAAALLTGRLQAAAVLLVVPLVLFHGGSDQGGPWGAQAGVGVLVGLLFQLRAHGALRSSVSRFVAEALVLLYVVDAGVLFMGHEQAATLFAAYVSALSAGVHSIVRREIAAERFACTALLLAFTVLSGENAPGSSSFLAVVAMGGVLQLAAIKARNAFAYRVALALVVLGAIYPVALLFNFTGEDSATRDSSGAVLIGLASGAVLLLFGRRVVWRRDPAWWRSIITLRSAVQVRALYRTVFASLGDIPLIGPFVTLARRAIGVLQDLVRGEHPLGLPELIVLSAQIYLAAILTRYLTDAASQVGLSVAAEMAVVAAIWSGIGLVSFAIGLRRGHSYLEFGGFAFVAASLVRTCLAPGFAGTGVAAMISGSALVAIGTGCILSTGRR